MTTVSAAYRLTVYKARSVSSAETVALTPAAGAVHSDDFKVASITGVSGFQPYLDGNSVRARGGKLDGLTCHTDVGELTAVIQDQRTTAGGTNLERWLTAFFGDAKGVRQLEGCKALVERSLDGGTTWATYFTGRVYAPKGLSLLRWQLVIRDMSAERMKIFTGKPHATASYAALMTQCPVGTSIAYGEIPAGNRLTGTMRTFTYTQAGAAVYHGFALDTDSVRRADNIITDAVRKQLGGLRSISAGEGVVTGLKTTQKPRFENRLRCRLRNVGSGLEGVFYVGSVIESGITGLERSLPQQKGQLAAHPSAITGIVISPLDPSDPEYLQMSDVPDGAVVDGYLYIDDVVSEENPLLIGDVSIGTLWKDLCDGYFSRLYPAKKPDELAEPIPRPAGKNVGDPIFGFAHQDADVGAVVGFTNLAADTTLPTVRFVITKSEDFWDWVEKNLLRPFRLAYRLTSDGKVQPLDLRMPTSAPGMTIADADCLRLPTDWEPMPGSAVSRVDAKVYAEFASFAEAFDGAPTQSTRTLFGGAVAAILSSNLAAVINASEYPITIVDLGSVDVGDNPLSLDFQGLRAQPGEKSPTSTNRVDRGHWCVQKVIEFTNHLRSPYGRGPLYVTVTGRQESANITDCQAGDLRLVTVTSLPDPATNKRGGTRVMRCLGWREDGLTRTLTMLDLGISTVASAPTVGTPTQNSPDTEHAIDVVVTVNASTEPAVLHVNLTATSVGTRPADSDAGWFYAGRATITGTVTVRNLPSNKRAWVRVRTEPVSHQYPKLPSAWAYPAGTGYVATSAITAPSATSESDVTGRRFVGNWTVGNSKLVLKVYLALSGETLQHVATLPPGSTSYAFEGLDLSTAYDWGVSHDDGMGGESSVATDSRTTSATAAVCPPAGVFILLAGTV
jgi:hypothetical protein